MITSSISHFNLRGFSWLSFKSISFSSLFAALFILFSTSFTYHCWNSLFILSFNGLLTAKYSGCSRSVQLGGISSTRMLLSSKACKKFEVVWPVNVPNITKHEWVLLSFRLRHVAFTYGIKMLCRYPINQRLLERMNLVKRKGTTTIKMLSCNFEKLKKQFLSDVCSTVAMEEIPEELIINWDQWLPSFWWSQYNHHSLALWLITTLLAVTMMVWVFTIAPFSHAIL